MAERGSFEVIVGELGQLLLPLRDALASADACFGFMVALGWEPDAIPAPLVELGSGLEALYAELGTLLGKGGIQVSGSVSLDGASGSVSADAIGRALHAVQQVIAGIRAIATSPAIPAKLRDDGFATIFPRQLLDFLIASYLRRYHPRLGYALRALGIIRFTYHARSGARLSYVHCSVDLAALPAVLTDPGHLLAVAFGWGTPGFDFRELMRSLEGLLLAANLNLAVGDAPDAALPLVGASGALAVPRAHTAVIFERLHPTGRFAALVRLLELPAAGPAPGGLALVPSFDGPLDFPMQLGPDLRVSIRSDLPVAGGVGLRLRPGHELELVGLGGGPAAPKGSIDVRVARARTDGAPTIILGTAGATRLQLRNISAAGGVRLQHGSTLDMFVEFELMGLEFVLQTADADGFIAKVLPAGGIAFGTDLAVGLSQRTGFSFRGTSNLEIAVPAHVQLGPVEIQGLVISATPSGAGVPIGLGVTFRAALGPLRAVVEQIGLAAQLGLRNDHAGNLGPIDLALAFKPPKGVGLAVDAGIVRGGGYLFADPARGEYAGALELTFAEIVSVKAIGIITTKLPDGSPGFSLLILMSVEFGTGIQLGLGFTLLAVGGLLGLNRAMNLDALADGVRTGAVTSVMFPQDVVANAPKIISDLRVFFPAREGTFLIGPMVKLGWGTPTVVSVSLAVIIEIPGNVAILGVLRVVLPAEDVALIRLQVQFIGALEFDKQRLWFFASLFDSRIVFITIDGEMGLLVGWGGDATFVVSVGGFHPRFSPPALPFPSPRRIHVSLLSSPVSKVTVEGYFAVTTNTVQFGASVDVFFGLSELNVRGYLGFDALFQFSPFHFIIDISASFSVNVFGAGLFSVGVQGSLEGPGPWHIKGHGSISLLFWDVDVDFETTWGESRDTQLPPVSVMGLLADELAKPQAWRAIAPERSHLFVTLRELAPDEVDLVLHPMGVLRISQRAVPLQLKLDTIGNRRPSDVNRVVISAGGGGLGRRDDAFELFAPAQFRALSDADKLSQPAFAPERSGLDLSAAGPDTRTSGVVKRFVRYEEIIIDNNFKRFARRFSPFLGRLFEFFLGGNAASRLAVSKATRERLAPYAEKVTVAAETYAVAFQADNRAHPDHPVFTSAASAHDYLAARRQDDPALADALHVIPGFEVVR